MLHRRISLNIIVIVCLLTLFGIEALGQGKTILTVAKYLVFHEVPIRSYPVGSVLSHGISLATRDLRLYDPVLPAQQSIPQLYDKQHLLRQTRTLQMMKYNLRRFEEFERLHTDFQIKLSPIPPIIPTTRKDLRLDVNSHISPLGRIHYTTPNITNEWWKQYIQNLIEEQLFKQGMRFEEEIDEEAFVKYTYGYKYDAA